jgi:hypothetical protein
MLMVPQVVRAKALNASAEDWLDNLSGVIADLEQEWAMRVGQCYADSTEAYVAEVLLGDGTLCSSSWDHGPTPRRSTRSAACVWPMAKGARACCVLTSGAALLLERAAPCSSCSSLSNAVTRFCAR